MKAIEFLFHTGSIKSIFKDNKDFDSTRFYSILVRLKVKLAVAESRSLPGFYSILVRLKEALPPPPLALITSFYSILVRLKVHSPAPIYISGA